MTDNEYQFTFIASIRGTGTLYADDKEDVIRQIMETGKREFLNNEGIFMDIDEFNIEDIENIHIIS